MESLAGNTGKTTDEQKEKLKGILGEKKYEVGMKEAPNMKWMDWLKQQKDKILTAQETTGAKKKSRRGEYTMMHSQAYGLQTSQSPATEKGQGIMAHTLVQILKAVRNEENDLIGIKEAISKQVEVRGAAPTAKQMEDAFERVGKRLREAASKEQGPFRSAFPCPRASPSRARSLPARTRFWDRHLEQVQSTFRHKR